jgi:dTDP-4-dehydrorhamnose 3,5-epimerase
LNTPGRWLVLERRRDNPGPQHAPVVDGNGAISGVVLQSAPFVTYGGDNVLTELFRPEWRGVFAEGETIDHLYTVKAPSGGVRKEWYFHEKTLDRYMILDGLLDIGLYDARVDSPTYGKFTLVSLGEPGSGLPNAIRIPPLVWHSLKWVTSRGQILNAKHPPYNREIPDKFRIPLEELPKAITWNI